MKRFGLFVVMMIAAMALLAGCNGATEKKEANADKKEIKIGATAGPYSDQLNKAIKPFLEKKGYKVTIVEFNDYIQPNHALNEGDIDANVFQNELYFKRFAKENHMDLAALLTVPTAPIGLYSDQFKSLKEIKEGAKITMPNDPVNQARSLIMLQELGLIKLKEDIDPAKASEKDVAENPKKLQLLPIEAAQIPRSLNDADFAFINGNFAISSGLKLTEAISLEKTPNHYLINVVVKEKDKQAPFAKDLEEAYRSSAFKEYVNRENKGFIKPDYLK